MLLLHLVLFGGASAVVRIGLLRLRGEEVKSLEKVHAAHLDQARFLAWAEIGKVLSVFLCRDPTQLVGWSVSQSAGDTAAVSERRDEYSRAHFQSLFVGARKVRHDDEPFDLLGAFCGHGFAMCKRSRRSGVGVVGPGSCLESESAIGAVRQQCSGREIAEV